MISTPVAPQLNLDAERPLIGTTQLMVDLLGTECAESQKLACRTLASLGELAVPALPHLRRAAEIAEPRVRAAAESAIVAILRAMRSAEHAEPRSNRFLSCLLAALAVSHS